MRVHSLTPSHTLENMKCDFRTSLLAHTFVNFYLGYEPKARVVTWMHHHINGSTHAYGKTKCLLNRIISPITNAHENFSIEASAPNIFSSNSSTITLTIVATVDALIAIGFSHSKQTIKRGMTILASYSMANQMAFPCPNKSSKMCKDLKCGSNMMAIIL